MIVKMIHPSIRLVTLALAAFTAGAPDLYQDYENVEVAVPVYRRQDNSTLVPGTASAVCDANIGVTREGWVEFGIGAFIQSVAVDAQPFSQGFQDTMKDLAGGIGNYACGPDLQCEVTGALSDACSDAPEAVAALIGMANFNNFFRSLREEIRDELDVLSNELAALTNLFAPPDISSIPSDSDIQLPSLLLTAFGALAAIFPPLAGVGAAATITGAALPAFFEMEEDPRFGSNFDAFADIGASVGAVRDQLTQGLEDFVDQRLNIVPTGPAGDTFYREDPTELPQILANGDFAEPTVNLPAGISDNLRTVLSAHIVNKLWTDQKAFITKFSQTALARGGTGADPCGGNDNVFNSDNKFCDEDGNAYVLQKIPNDAILSGEAEGVEFSRRSLIDLSLTRLPGAEALSDFGLDVQTIAQSSESNQNRFGFMTAPAIEEVFSSFGDFTPADMDIKKSMIFTLPVCDLDTVVMNSAGEIACKSRFEGNEVCYGTQASSPPTC